MATYVQFLYPGFLFLETEERRVSDRNPDRLAIPENCIGYRFYDRSGKQRTNVSKVVYNGEILTKEDIERKFGDQAILLENMRLHECRKVLHTRNGKFIPLNMGKRTIDNFLDNSEFSCIFP